MLIDDLRELAWRPLLEGCHSYVHLRMGPRRAIPAMVNLRTENNANHCEYHKYNNALTVSFLLHMRRKFVRHRCSLPHERPAHHRCRLPHGGATHRRSWQR
jgi:hypothetical protein